MKKVNMGHGVTVETPYLTAAEAAEYLSISERTFRRISGDFACTGATAAPRYDCRELDTYLQRKGKEGGP